MTLESGARQPADRDGERGKRVGRVAAAATTLPARGVGDPRRQEDEIDCARTYCRSEGRAVNSTKLESVKVR